MKQKTDVDPQTVESLDMSDVFFCKKLWKNNSDNISVVFNRNDTEN